MTYSKQFVSDTARAWLASQIRNFAIDPYDAEEVYSEVMETSDLDSMGDYLDGAGYPELAEQWERDWHVEDISVEELYAELTEGEDGRMKWRITHDLIDTDQVGKSNARLGEEVGGSLTFRLLDGDGEVYYIGVCDAPDPESLDFGPLDWGMYFAGCTEMQYRLVDSYTGRGHWFEL